MKNTVITHALLADAMATRAKDFRKSRTCAEIVRRYGGKVIDERVVRALLVPFTVSVRSALSDYEIGGYLARKLDEFVPNAVHWAEWNRHMHDAAGEPLFDADWADALLVGYINHAYKPGGLGLCAEHLRERED